MSDVNILYFDEAGYTGSDLLNNEQPYFCLASCLFTEEELQQIQSDFSIGSNGKELHFKQMVKYPQTRQLLLKLLRHPLMTADRIVTAYAHKRYCIHAQIVNTLIEAYLYKNGLNIYEGKAHVLLANMLYKMAVSHPCQELVYEFESQYVAMMREGNEEAMRRFFHSVDEILRHPDTDSSVRKVLELIRASIEVIEDVLVDDKFYLDNTVSLFVSHLSIWHERREKVKFDVFFDSSKPIDSKKTLLDALGKLQVPAEKPNLPIPLPLPLNEIKLVDSTQYFGVQIADVIASALCSALSGKLPADGGFRDEIMKCSFIASPSWRVCAENGKPAAIG